MATSTNSTMKAAALAAGAFSLLALLIVGCWLWFRSPPQMGADKEAVKAVDALYTAVTSHDEKRLAQCEQRLHSLKDAGKLPGDSSDFLDGIIQTARHGDGRAAVEKLYWFIKKQRYEPSPGRTADRQ